MKFDTLASFIASHPDRSTGAGATDDEIEQAEQMLRVRILGGYRDFLSRFGWGGVGHLELYGLGGDRPAHLDLTRITQSERSEMRPRLRHDLIPVMNDGAGNLYCIDTGVVRANEPPIVFWCHEDGEGQKPEPVAEDFSSWLQSLLDDL